MKRTSKVKVSKWSKFEGLSLNLNDPFEQFLALELKKAKVNFKVRKR
jgi:hypothetical protein